MLIILTLIAFRNGANLEFFFLLGPLFLSSILTFLSLTPFLSGDGRVLDLRGWVGGGGLDTGVF